MMRTTALISAVAVALLCIPGAAEVSSAGISDVAWHSLPEADAPTEAVEVRQIHIPELGRAPDVDGQLQEGEWVGAAVAENWQISRGDGPAPVQTTAYLGVHDDMLYMGFECNEPNVDDIRAEVTEDGGRVWTDDDVEIFVDGNHDRASFRQIIVNSIGTVTTVRSDDEWDIPVVRGTHVREYAWYAELAVPADDLGITTSSFGFNLCRERYAGEGDVQLSCWNPTGGSFTHPEKFGTATVPGQPLQFFGSGVLSVGDNEATAVIQNPTEDPTEIWVLLRWRQGNDWWSEVRSEVQQLQPGQQQKIRLPYRIKRLGEPVVLEVNVQQPSEEGDLTPVQHVVQRPVRGSFALDLNQHIFLPGDSAVPIRVVTDIQEDLTGASDLCLALCSEPDGRPLFARQIDEIKPGVVTGVLELNGVEPGDYSLCVALREHRNGIHRIAESREPVRILPPLQ